MAGVYLIYRNRLFRDTVGAILTIQPGITLLGATDQPDTAASEIAALAPSVILLEEVEDGPSLRDVHHILTSPIPCRLITLGLDQDGMHVWSQTWRQTVGPQDLVEAIITAREDRPCPEQGACTAHNRTPANWRLGRRGRNRRISAVETGRITTRAARIGCGKGERK